MIGSIGPCGVVPHDERWSPCGPPARPESLSTPEDPRGRVRVGLWAPDLNLGGAEDWQRTLVKAVDRSRVSWQGLAVTCGPIATDARVVGEFSGTMPVAYGPAGARALAARCDVIVQWAVAGCAGILEGLRPRPRVVAVLHWPEESGWVKTFYDQPGGIDAFVAVSELAVPTAPAAHAGAVATIWNALDPARLTPKRGRAEVRRGWGVPEGAKVLGFLGRLEPGQKDPEALARARPHLPDGWHCVVVGEGVARGRLEDAARADPGLHVPRGDRDAGSVLGAFDALCVPSACESFGLSLCEGLWVGLPVLSTRTGVCKLVRGLTREIPVGATGEAVALALYQDLYHAEATRARVGRARDWARRVLDPERFGREWTDYLVSLAARKDPAR